MITRIVKLSFDPSHCKTFEEIFANTKSAILDFKGCHDVLLYQDLEQTNVYFTYSHWDDENALNNYRNSNFFNATWVKVKALFNDKPQAWTLTNTLS